MSDRAWKEVRNYLGESRLSLGNLYSHSALFAPRRLLFVLARYKFAAKLLPQDHPVKVLELGCSEGLPTIMLAENGHNITAVDFDENAISYARENIVKDNISFLCDNFIGKTYGSFQAVVSLDVIEHIEMSHEDKFMETIYANLEPHGFAVIGTPNITAQEYASEGSKIGHVNLYSAERLTALMRKYFHNVFVFGMNDEVVHTGFYPMCHYLFVMGCSKK